MKSFLTFLFLATGVSALAQIVPVAGPYTTADGGYTINISAEKDTVTVIEPNKKSVYTKVAANEYQFVNPKNDIEYRIEVLSKTELAFFKPATRDNKTKLSFSGAMNEASTNANFEKFSKIAEAYTAKIETQPNDTQLWVLCAATAMARATLNDEGFEDYARKAGASMKALLENKSVNPCPDVIPAALWKSIPQ